MTQETSKELTVEHIKFATPTQLGKLLAKNPNTISRWNRIGFKSTLLKIQYLCVNQETLITGLIRRREEFGPVEKLQKEFDEILENSEKLEETAVA